MNRRTGVVVAAIVIGMTLPALAADSVRKQVAEKADEIVSTLRVTGYSHVERIDPAAGVYVTDCSGFVSYVLQQTAPTQFGKVPKESSWPYPRAYMYYTFFQTLPTTKSGDWRQIVTLGKTRKGDIIAWKLGSVTKGSDTGHVMIVDEDPKSSGPGLYLVKVCDCSVIPHHSDSRIRNGKYHAGVGTGYIMFRTHAAGQPIAFQFGSGDNFHTLSIDIGRPEPEPAP